MFGLRHAEVADFLEPSLDAIECHVLAKFDAPGPLRMLLVVTAQGQMQFVEGSRSRRRSYPPEKLDIIYGGDVLSSSKPKAVDVHGRRYKLSWEGGSSPFHCHACFMAFTPQDVGMTLVLWLAP